MGKKGRRNISIDAELNEWLEERENMSRLIFQHLPTHFQYGLTHPPLSIDCHRREPV